MSDDSVKLGGFGSLARKLKENNIDVSEDELSSLFSQALESSKDGKINVSEFSNTLAETYGLKDNSEILDTISQIASNDGVDDDLSIADFEKQKEIEETKDNTTFSSQLDENTSEALISVLENLVASQETSLNSIKENNGVIAGLWDKFKNFTGIGAGSSKVQNEIDKYKEEIEKVKNGELSLDEVYEDITGNALNEDEFNALVNGNVDYSKSDFLKTAAKYKQGQKQVVNTISSVGSALAITGLVASGIFTGGMSWLAAGAICVGAGTGAYMLPQAIDGLTEKDGYSAMELAEDLAVGTINSLVQTVTMGTAKGVSNAITNKVSNQTIAKILSAETTSLELGVGMATGDYLAEAGVTRLDDLDLTEEDEIAYEQIANGELKEGDEGYEEALEKANKYYSAISNNSDLSLQGLTTTTLTATAASLAAGASVVGTQGTFGTTLAKATMNSSGATQIGARLLTGGISGAAAGASATFVGGGTSYLLTTDGSEITLSDWLNSSTENLASGAITGFASGVTFEAVQIASGTPAPENTNKIKKNQTDDNGLKYTEYVDKDGNVIARDYKASDVLDYMTKNSQEGLTSYSQETAANNAPNNARTVRVTYDSINKTVGQTEIIYDPISKTVKENTTYKADGTVERFYQLDWYDNAMFLGQKVNLGEMPNGNTSFVVDEQGNVISENSSLLLENATMLNEETALAPINNNETQISTSQDNLEQMTQTPNRVAVMGINSGINAVNQTTNTTTAATTMTKEELEAIVEQRLTNYKNLEGLTPRQIARQKKEATQVVDYLSNKFEDSYVELSKEAIIEILDAGQYWEDLSSAVQNLTSIASKEYIGRAYVLTKLVNSGSVTSETLENTTQTSSVRNSFSKAFNKNISDDSNVDYFEETLKQSDFSKEQIEFAKKIANSIQIGDISDSDLGGIDWQNLSFKDESAAEIIKSGADFASTIKYQSQLDYKKFLEEIPEGSEIQIEALQNNVGVRIVAIKTSPSVDNPQDATGADYVDVKKTVTMDSDGNISKSTTFLNGDNTSEAYYQNSDRTVILNEREVEVGAKKKTKIKIPTSQIEIVNNENGEPSYALYTKESSDLTGAFETTRYDLKDYPEDMDIISAIKDGTITGGTKLSTVTSDDGSTSYVQNYEQNGNTISRNYNSQVDEDGNLVSTNYQYQINSENGDSLLSVDRSWTKNADGSTTTVINGKTYTATFDDSTRAVTVTQEDGTETNYSINEMLEKQVLAKVYLHTFTGKRRENFIEGDSCFVNSLKQREDFWAMVKTLPADQLINLGTNVKEITILNSINRNCISLEGHLKICADVGVISHELGHSVDTENKELGKISQNEELIKIYNDEMKSFTQKYPELSQDIIDYFSQTGGGLDDSNTGLSELVAETNTLMTTYGHDSDRINARAEYLVQYFPQTVAKIGELLGYDANTTGTIADTTSNTTSNITTSTKTSEDQETFLGLVDSDTQSSKKPEATKSLTEKGMSKEKAIKDLVKKGISEEDATKAYETLGRKKVIEILNSENPVETYKEYLTIKPLIEKGISKEDATKIYKALGQEKVVEILSFKRPAEICTKYLDAMKSLTEKKVSEQNTAEVCKALGYKKASEISESENPVEMCTKYLKTIEKLVGKGIPEKLATHACGILSLEELSEISEISNLSEIPIQTFKERLVKKYFSKFVDEKDLDFVTSVLFNAATWVDSKAQVTITKTQMNELAAKGATKENTIILAPQPNKGKLKSYTHAARDLIEISQETKLPLDGNKSRTEVELSSGRETELPLDENKGRTSGCLVEGDAFIVITDDCSVTGNSIIEDAINSLKITGKEINGTKTICFLPTVLGKKAETNIKNFIEAYEKISLEAMKEITNLIENIEKTDDKIISSADVSSMSESAQEFYKILTYITDYSCSTSDSVDIRKNRLKKLKTFASNVQNLVNNRENIKFELVDGIKAQDYRDTTIYQSLSKEEQAVFDMYATGGKQSFGYNGSATMIAIEGYTNNSNKYKFNNEITSEDAKQALGITEGLKLPVKGNSPNNNIPLVREFAIALGIDKSRVKISGDTIEEIYMQLARDGYTIRPSVYSEDGKSLVPGDKTYSIMPVLNHGKYNSKYNVCGTICNAGDKVKITYELGASTYESIVELPETSGIQEDKIVEFLKDSLAGDKTTKISGDSSETEVSRGVKIVLGSEGGSGTYEGGGETLIEKKTDKYVIAVPESARNVKVEVVKNNN